MNGEYKPFSPNSSVEVERLEMALDAAGVGTWELDLINNTLRWCSRTKVLFGFSGEDIISYDQFIGLIQNEDKHAVDKAVRQAFDLNIQTPFDIQFRIITEDHKETRWLRCKGNVYTSGQNTPTRLLGIVQNISQDIQSQLNLRDSEEKFRTLVENTPDVITRWDTNLQLVFANVAFEGKTGIQNQDLLGKTIEEMAHAEKFSGPFMSALQSVMKNARPEEFHNSFPTHNGELFFFSRLVPEFDNEGNVQSIISISRDITELKSSEARFQTIVEQAPMAIGLLRGRDMIIEIGNDHIFEVWGKDSSVTGKPLLEALPELEDQIFLKLLQDVYDTGNPFFGHAVKAELFRNQVLEDVYFDFVYTPLRDKSGAIYGIMVLATEVTTQVLSLKALEASEAKFRSLIEEAPIATCLFVGRELKIEIANNKILDFWGKDKSVFGQPLVEAVPELVGQPFIEILNQVFTTGITYEGFSEPALLLRDGVLGTYYYDYTYKPLKNAQGEVYAIMDMAVDVTQQVLARKALEESESKLRSVIAAAPAGIVVFNGRDLIVDMPNQAFIDIIGKNFDIIGKPLAEAMPELKNQPFLQILDDVFTSGKMYQSSETQVAIVKNGIMTHNFYNFSYTPLFDGDGKVFAILDVSVEVADEVKARQKLEESELFSRNIIDNSPVAKLVLIGEEMIVRMVNENMLEMLGKDHSIIGKNIRAIMPELKNSPLLDRLKNVLETGNIFIQPEEKIESKRHGKTYTGYYNYVYKALTDVNQKRYGIIVTATEVTDQVVARKKIEEAEQSLRDAVELAELGTWILDPVRAVISNSKRMSNWIGFDQEEVALADFLSTVDEKDRERINVGIKKSLEPDSNRYYLEEYVVTNKITKQRRILQARGRAFFDENNQPYLMRGTAQDVTEQRLLQISLEQQVRERTEELEASNQELASINEEYLVTNEELADLNLLLTQSNQNLQQFAYIASHDLQEPLRKIQSFGNLLSSRYKDSLGEGTHLIERMQTAANRMSVLIQDLLAFSRISNKQDATNPVDLNKVVDVVLSDLELITQDTGAIITVDELPVIQGDESQLGQLFQNLIGNALKFRDPETAPIINITFDTMDARQLPDRVKPSRMTDRYYRISVADNGIGFDQKYADRIFQVFQRLHGRSEFAGTGIGLAICEKVASNHGGAIAAFGEPGVGATFSIYFPV
jgi:PAS domain S-box-containing protein